MKIMVMSVVHLCNSQMVKCVILKMERLMGRCQVTACWPFSHLKLKRWFGFSEEAELLIIQWYLFGASYL